MRVTTSLAAALLLAGLASAQCGGYIAPPRAPDFQNTAAVYINTCFGMKYGPNYCVYPNFPPFQGMLPGPPCQTSCFPLCCQQGCCPPPCPPGCMPMWGGGPPGTIYPGPLFAGVNHAGVTPPGGWAPPPYPMAGPGPYGPWGLCPPGYGYPASPYDPRMLAMANPWANGAGGSAADAARMAAGLGATNAGGAAGGYCPPWCTPQQWTQICAMYPNCSPAMLAMCLPPPNSPYPPQQPQGPGDPGNGGGGGGGGQQGIAAFPTHLYARGPRDYFMVETDPRASPYSYGLVSPSWSSPTPQRPE
jgi:hypothetical protein